MISVALADVHIITDTDYISHERDHVSCLTNSLTMSDLRFASRPDPELQDQAGYMQKRKRNEYG